MKGDESPSIDLALVFPPWAFSSVNSPHLALGQLCSFLKTSGMNVITWDGNIRFARSLMSRDRLARIIDKSREAFETLNNETTLEAVDYVRFRRLSKLASVSLNEVERCQAIESDFGGMWPTALELAYGEALGSIATDLRDVIRNVVDGVPSVLRSFLDEQEASIERLSRATVVGINVSFAVQMESALLFAQRLKAHNGSGPPLCILGGTQISLLSEPQLSEISQLPFIDGVVVYEGEKPLLKLLQRMRQVGHDLPAGTTPDLADVPNLWIKGRPPRTLAAPVEPHELPTPIYNSNELGLYYEPRCLPVYVTKGCYWGKCTFCDYTKLYTPDSRRWCERRPEQVADDIQHLIQQHRIMSFRLISEAVPPKWYREFASLVIRRRLQAQLWSYLKNERSSVLNQEFFDLIYRAGVREVTCGVESAEDRVLAIIDKGTTRQDIADNLSMLAVAGIRATCNLIPDYPSIRFAEAQNTIRFVYENIDYIPRLNHQFFDLSIQSAIAGSPETFEIQVDPGPYVSSSHGCHSMSFVHKTLSAEEHKLLKQAYDALRTDVKRYHATKDVMRIIFHPNFDWRQSAFVLSRLTYVRTRFPSLLICQDPDDMSASIKCEDEQLHVNNWELGSEILIPAGLEPLLMVAQERGLVSFDAIVFLLSQVLDVDAHADDSLASEVAKKLVFAMASLGFVEKVFHGLRPDLSSPVCRMCDLTPPGRGDVCARGPFPGGPSNAEDA